jgi:hypothetical protein
LVVNAVYSAAPSTGSIAAASATLCCRYNYKKAMNNGNKATFLAGNSTAAYIATLVQML